MSKIESTTLRDDCMNMLRDDELDLVNGGKKQQEFKERQAEIAALPRDADIINDILKGTIFW